MMGPMDIVVLGTDKSFPNKAFLMLLSIRMRGCLPLDHKGKVVSPYGPLVLGVVRDMRVGVWPVERVALVVVKVVTK